MDKINIFQEAQSITIQTEQIKNVHNKVEGHANEKMFNDCCLHICARFSIAAWFFRVYTFDDFYAIREIAKLQYVIFSSDSTQYIHLATQISLLATGPFFLKRNLNIEIEFHFYFIYNHQLNSEEAPITCSSSLIFVE